MGVEVPGVVGILVLRTLKSHQITMQRKLHEVLGPAYNRCGSDG